MAALFFDAVTAFFVITYFAVTVLFSVIALSARLRFCSGKVFSGKYVLRQLLFCCNPCRTIEIYKPVACRRKRRDKVAAERIIFRFRNKTADNFPNKVTDNFCVKKRALPPVLYVFTIIIL